MTAVSAYARLETALAEYEPPFAVVDLDAFRANASDLEIGRASCRERVSCCV